MSASNVIKKLCKLGHKDLARQVAAATKKYKILKGRDEDGPTFDVYDNRGKFVGYAKSKADAEGIATDHAEGKYKPKFHVDTVEVLAGAYVTEKQLEKLKKHVGIFHTAADEPEKILCTRARPESCIKAGKAGDYDTTLWVLIIAAVSGVFVGYGPVAWAWVRTWLRNAHKIPRGFGIPVPKLREVRS